MDKKEIALLFGSLINWVEIGGELTAYKCPHCKKKVCTRIPTEELVGSKGYWDSAKVCYKCGKLSFVVIYPSGALRVKKLGN